MDQKPSIGRIVTYVLNEIDAESITKQDRFANPTDAGMELPAIVVRAWSDDMVNLQVFIDGVGTLWATSRRKNDDGAQGTWHWPARV